MAASWSSKFSLRSFLRALNLSDKHLGDTSFLSFSTAGMSGKGPVEKTIEEKLTKAFKPTHLQVINESHMHNVPRGSETHFKVLVVSDAFADQPLLARHRAVNETLRDELSSGVHALSVVAKTARQWAEAADKTVESSPACKGGFGK